MKRNQKWKIQCTVLETWTLCFTPREKCPNTELFLVRISLYSDWIRNTVSLRIKSEYRKIWTKNNSVFGHFSRSELYVKDGIASWFVKRQTSFVVSRGISCGFPIGDSKFTMTLSASFNTSFIKSNEFSYEQFFFLTKYSTTPPR